MGKKTVKIIALGFFFQSGLAGAACEARGQAEKARYAAMAPVDQYLMADENSEIALARSAAPASISGAAEVMVLGRTGYRTAVNGSNGFLCVVERSWGAATDEPEFWNPKVRSPICFNPPAARSFALIFLMKTKLALAGKSKAEIVAATATALEKGELPAVEPGAMCYMMSKQQYLSDRDMSWHPHLMFFVPGAVAKSWGANLPGSPVLAADDPEEGVTIFLVWAGKWSDGTLGPAAPAAVKMVTCTSDGSRKYCDASTGGGVRLAKQLGDAPCKKGDSWDYDGLGIWVDKGCSAEFALGGAQAASSASGDAANEEAAKEKSCLEQVGKARSEQMVKQCLQVSPATHPPCNAQNSCEVIEDEIRRSCGLLGLDAPSFCGGYK